MTMPTVHSGLREAANALNLAAQLVNDNGKAGVPLTLEQALAYAQAQATFALADGVHALVAGATAGPRSQLVVPGAALRPS